MSQKNKKLGHKGLFIGKIDKKWKAKELINGVSIFLFLLAGLNIFIGLFLTQYEYPALPFVFEALLLVVLGALFILLRSRIMAIIIFLYSLSAFGITLLNLAGLLRWGGTNWILALLLVWISIRGVQASFVYSKYKGRKR